MTRQLEAWKGEFGLAFTDRFDIPLDEAEERSRRSIGRSISDSFRQLLDGLDVTRILEVGCNAGQKLALLGQLGTFRLYGVEPQPEALRRARSRLVDANLVEGDAFDLPFRDSFFDVVFTSVLLIHIAPPDLPRALAEIYRVSGRYIMGMEFHSNELEELEYRGEHGLLWKMDFEKRYKELFPDLKTVRSEVFEYDESVYNRRGLYDKHFVLSKW